MIDRYMNCAQNSQHSLKKRKIKKERQREKERERDRDKDKANN